MGGKGIQQSQESIIVLNVGHHGGDGGVHLQRVDIVGDFLDGLVENGLVGGGQLTAVRRGLRQIPHLVQKALGALHGIG